MSGTSIHPDRKHRLSHVIITCHGSPLNHDVLFDHTYEEGKEEITAFDTGPDNGNLRLLLKTVPMLRSEFYKKDDDFFVYLRIRKWLVGF